MRLDVMTESQRAALLRQLTLSLGGPATLGDKECGVALRHAGSSSPLWLKLLAQEIAKHHLNQAPSTQDSAEGVRSGEEGQQLLSLIAEFPASASAVFDRQLAQLDGTDGLESTTPSGHAQLVLAAAGCTAGGLYEEQLLQLLDDSQHSARALREDSPQQASGASTADIWSELLTVGLGAILRVSPRSEWTNSQLRENSGRATCGFVHMQARDAVWRRYLSSREQQRRTHLRLATYFSSVLGESSGRSGSKLRGVDGQALVLGERAWVQCLRRLPLHWTLSTTAGDAQDKSTIKNVGVCCERSRLLQLSFVEAKARAHLTHELLEDYARAIATLRLSGSAPAGSGKGSTLLERMEDFRDMVQKSAHVLSAQPWLVSQLALNERDTSSTAAAAKAQKDDLETRIAQPRNISVQWLNKPQQRAACIRTFTGMGGLIWALDVSSDQQLAIGGSDCLVRTDTHKPMQLGADFTDWGHRLCETFVQVHVLSYESGDETATLAYHTDDITCVCWVNKSTLVTAADGDPLCVWSIASPEKPAKLLALDKARGVCTGLACSADGRLVACCQRECSRDVHHPSGCTCESCMNVTQVRSWCSLRR
jgi:hypothetical protein